MQNIFPKTIAATLIKNPENQLLCDVIPVEYSFSLLLQVYNCTVVFVKLDILLPLEEQIKEASMLFSLIDGIISSGDYPVEKIKTTGLRYIFACGLPDANPYHAKIATEVRHVKHN